MLAFWLITGLIAAVAAVTVLAFAARAAAASGRPPAQEAAARQFDELDALRDRGLLEEENWRVARAEAARRLLKETVPPVGPRAAAPAHRLWVLAGVAATAALAIGLYLVTGAPGAADQPYADRVDAWSENLEGLDPPRLAAVAERVAEGRPDDLQAWVFVGRARFEAGDALGAASAFRKALEQDADAAQVWAWLGESLTAAQGGVVGADAEAAFRRALERDPEQGAARYYLGRAALERGELAAAREHWGALLALLPANDPRRRELEQVLDAAAAQ